MHRNREKMERAKAALDAFKPQLMAAGRARFHKEPGAAERETELRLARATARNEFEFWQRIVRDNERARRKAMRAA